MLTKTRGFTLVELMIVIAVLAIVVAVGYPSYLEQVKKSRRAEGMGQLLELADRMERAYSDRGFYPPPSAISEVYTATTDGGFYLLSIVSSNNVSFVVSAAPTSLGNQDKDKCTSFSMTSLGNKWVGDGTDDSLNNYCWK